MNDRIAVRDGTLDRGDLVLYYRTYGQGAPLLLIHGVACDSDLFEETAGQLAACHMVITYDRRGYSRSSGQPGPHFWQEQAEDAAQLLLKLCAGTPAMVVGCSAGAIIAMHLSVLHPELVKGLILHEPPLIRLLPPEHEAIRAAEKIHAAIEEGKYHRAVNRFILLIGAGDARAPEKQPDTVCREANNVMYFIRREFDDIFFDASLPDVPASIPAVLCAGDSHQGSYLYEIAHQLAARRGWPVVHFPGLHNCAQELPLDFAVGVEGVLSLLIPSGPPLFQFQKKD